MFLQKTEIFQRRSDYGGMLPRAHLQKKTTKETVFANFDPPF